jgi:thiol-disulfide isomerase/thioredoxin
LIFPLEELMLFWIKRLAAFLVCGFLLFSYSPAQARPPVAGDKVILYMFWGNGCPHCAEERPFLVDLGNRYPLLEVRAYEVWYNAGNMAQFQKMGQAFGYDPKGVPGTYLGDRHWDGFNASIGQDIEAALKTCLQSGCKDAGAGIISGGAPGPWPEAPEGGAPSAVPVAVTVALIAVGLLLVVPLVVRRLLKRARL